MKTCFWFLIIGLAIAWVYYVFKREMDIEMEEIELLLAQNRKESKE